MTDPHPSRDRSTPHLQTTRLVQPEVLLGDTRHFRIYFHRQDLHSRVHSTQSHRQRPSAQTEYKCGRRTISTVTHIQFTQGRTGKITPIIHIEPVTLQGKTIKKLTGYNTAFIQKHHVGIGSRVELRMRGSTIPSFVRLIPGTEASWDFTLPASKSPLCLSIYEMVDYRTKDTRCTERFKRQLTHFLGKGGLNISGLGKKSIARLVDSGVITQISDIFSLTPEQLASVLGWRLSRASVYVHALSQRRHVILSIQLKAIGIPGLTKADIRILASRHTSLSELLDSDVQSMGLSKTKQALMARVVKDIYLREELEKLANAFVSV